MTEPVLVVPAKGKWIFDASKRKYVYRIANVALLIAVAYGFVAVDKSALWLLLINAVLGLADTNTPNVTATGNNEPGVDRRPNDTLF